MSILPADTIAPGCLLAAWEALSRYVSHPSPVTLEYATEAVRAARKHHGPVVYGDWLWTLDGADELIRLKRGATAFHRGRKGER